MNKKAQWAVSLQGIIIVMVIVGVLLGVGFTVLGSFIGETDDYSGSVTNESITVNNETYVTLAYNSTSVVCWNTFAVTTVYNFTGGGVILSGNYTAGADGSLIAVGIPYEGGVWNVTYTYKYGKNACAGIEDTVTGVQTVPTWLGTLVLLAIVGILLLLLFTVLPRFGGGLSEGRLGGYGRSGGGVTAEI